MFLEGMLKDTYTEEFVCTWEMVVDLLFHFQLLMMRFEQKLELLVIEEEKEMERKKYGKRKKGGDDDDDENKDDKGEANNEGNNEGKQQKQKMKTKLKVGRQEEKNKSEKTGHITASQQIHEHNQNLKKITENKEKAEEEAKAKAETIALLPNETLVFLMNNELYFSPNESCFGIQWLQKIGYGVIKRLDSDVERLIVLSKELRCYQIGDYLNSFKDLDKSDFLTIDVDKRFRNNNEK